MKLPDSKEGGLLPLEFTHDGFTLRQVTREGMVAIYEKSRSPLGIKRYELVILRLRPAEMIRWKPYPARECYPNSEEWGGRGWTHLDREAAERAMRLLMSDQSKASNSPSAIVYGASKTLRRVKTAGVLGECAHERTLQ